MKKASSAAGQILLQRLQENPRYPRLARYAMTKMTSGEEAAAAWRVLGQDEKSVGKAFNRIRTAFEAALNEVARPNIKNEREEIASIIRLAKKLKGEIKSSSLPGDWCRSFEHELEAEDLPPVFLEIGWHSLRPGGYHTGYPVAVVDVLDWAIDMANKHVSGLPERAVIRRSNQPKVAAFVRHLAWQFGQEYEGDEKRGTIGHIATAIFDLDEPLDLSGVDGILRDRPEPFKPSKSST